jgi:hypothetical protein
MTSLKKDRDNTKYGKGKGKLLTRSPKERHTLTHGNFFEIF